MYLAESSDRDYLPHQEARMNAGLEKALQHKDKLLEYDKNRYCRIRNAGIVAIVVDFFICYCYSDNCGVIESEKNGVAILLLSFV